MKDHRIVRGKDPRTDKTAAKLDPKAPLSKLFRRPLPRTTLPHWGPPPILSSLDNGARELHQVGGPLLERREGVISYLNTVENVAIELFLRDLARLLADPCSFCVAA